MIIYVSSGTSYCIYNKHYDDGKICCGQQAQKFNNLLINGLAEHTKVISVAVMPFDEKKYVHTKRECIIDGNATFICIPNKPQKLIHKISNMVLTFKEVLKVCRYNKPSAVICDSINLSASFASFNVSKLMRIQRIAIVTDVPEIMCGEKIPIFMKMTAFLMKRYDAYVLLTKAMNDIVNPKGKPYAIIEGSCQAVNMSARQSNSETGKKICLFSGSMGCDSGLEILVEGFLKANIDNAELQFYGYGDFVYKLSAICEKHSNIKYCGTVTNDEIVCKQLKATLLINPRLSTMGYSAYSFPSKIMEYMASGTPILSTRLSGIPDEYFDYMYTIFDETVDGYKLAFHETLSKSVEELRYKGEKARQFVESNKNNVLQANKIKALIVDTKVDNLWCV